MALFASTSNDDVDNLWDISTTLPFESRPKAPKMNACNVCPRQLTCLNLPKQPHRPSLAIMGIGAQVALF